MPRAVIDRIKRGEDPRSAAPALPAEPTVADLAERYMRVHVATHCNAKTAEGYRYVMEKHILPALGTMRVRDVGGAEVVALHHELRSMPLTANRTVKIVSKMFKLAQGWKMVPAGRNPCRLVRRYKEEPRERFLSPDEWRRLGRALREAEADGSVWPQAIAALRLLLLTGCRRQEIVTLKWDDVDRTARELRLRHAKTGPRMVPLTPWVERVLDGIPRVEGSPWVIPGRKPDTHLADLHDHWERIRDRAGLENMRIPRYPSFVCLESSGRGRELDDDRPPARAFQGDDDGAVTHILRGTPKRRRRHGWGEALLFTSGGKRRGRLRKWAERIGG